MSGEINERNRVTVARPVTQMAALLVCLQVKVTIKDNFTSLKRLGRRALGKFFISTLCQI